MKGKKIKQTILMLFSVLLLFTACANKSEIKNPETKIKTESQTPISIAEQGLNIKPDEGLEIIENAADFTEVKESQEYHFETDNQRKVQGRKMRDCLETEDSYYFCRMNSVYVFDKESRRYSILCNKPNCSHVGSNTCNAYFSTMFYAMEYYKGNIYVLLAHSEELEEGESDEGMWRETLDLYRMSLDGSERTKVCTVASAIAQKGVEDNIYSVWYAEIHRGYLYLYLWYWRR